MPDTIWEQFLSSSNNREVLRDILSLCGLDDDTFVADPYRSAYNQGRRSMGIEILARAMELRPELGVELAALKKTP